MNKRVRPGGIQTHIITDKGSNSNYEYYLAVLAAVLRNWYYPFIRFMHFQYTSMKLETRGM
jgi:hypothetical protein